MTHAAAAEPVPSNDTATNDLACAQPSHCSKPRWEDRRLSTGKILGAVPDVAPPNHDTDEKGRMKTPTFLLTGHKAN